MHPMDKKKVEMWQAELFLLAVELFTLLIPHFILKQFVLHFEKMTNKSHEVPLHTDEKDISNQYAVHFGDWEGAWLVCYDNCNKKKMLSLSDEERERYVTFRTAEKRRLIKFDGRLLHQVIKKGFKGI